MPKVPECELGHSHDGEKANIEVEFDKIVAFGFLQNDDLNDLVDNRQEAFDEETTLDSLLGFCVITLLCL